MKKISLIIILILLNNCSGYEPVYNSKDLNFNIRSIEIEDGDKISYKIKRKLVPYTNQTKKLKNVVLKINTNKQINTIAKDSKGNDSVYEISVSTNVEILFENLEKKKLNFVEKFSFNNQTNKFELEQYKKDILTDLLDKIFEKLILELRIV